MKLAEREQELTDKAKVEVDGWIEKVLPKLIVLAGTSQSPADTSDATIRFPSKFMAYNGLYLRHGITREYIEARVKEVFETKFTKDQCLALVIPRPIFGYFLTIRVTTPN